MPELPEVETVRRRLAPVLLGRRIERAAILDERLTRPADPAEIAGRLSGERIREVGREGKYLVLELASGRALVVHLRMTGSFRLDDGDGVGDAYCRAVLALDDGRRVAFRDVRRFGTWALLEAPDVRPYLAARLGPEPLGPGFTARSLGERLAGRRLPVKAALLDQRVVAGVGNIYADEALWRARIDPLTPSGLLSRQQLARIVRAVRHVLRRGIELQGSSLGQGLPNFADPSGGYGSMQEEFRVYGRTGLPCPRCRAPITREVVAGRGTWSCPTCQPRSRARSRAAATAPQAASRSSSPSRSSRQSSR